MPDLKVECPLTDCLHFRRHADEPAVAYCAHPEKHLYLQPRACPLYKQAIDRKLEAALAERFKIGQKKKKFG